MGRRYERRWYATSRAARGARQLSARVPGRADGQLVPEARHGAGQRRGHRRDAASAADYPVFRKPLKRQWMFRITAYARAPARGARRPRLARVHRACMQRNWIGRSDGAEVDVPRSTASCRARIARVHHAARTRCSAPRTWCWRPSTRWSTLLDARPSTSAAVRSVREAARTRATSSGRAGQGQDRRVHRRVRHQSGQRRADSDLDRGLRADGLRHRRHHGRARAR